MEYGALYGESLCLASIVSLTASVKSVNVGV